MSQLKGAGVVMPIYYFIHYLTTPPRNFPATDDRMTNIAYVKKPSPSPHRRIHSPMRRHALPPRPHGPPVRQWYLATLPCLGLTYTSSLILQRQRYHLPRPHDKSQGGHALSTQCLSARRSDIRERLPLPVGQVPLLNERAFLLRPLQSWTACNKHCCWI
jgi:hypothetical protein